MSGTTKNRQLIAQTESLQERLAHTTEAKYLIEGHADGARAFIAAKRVGEDWAVIDNNAGWRSPDYWNGESWRPLHESTPHDWVYRWTRDEAEALAKHYAEQAAEIHKTYAGMTRPAFARWLAGTVEARLEQVREALAHNGQVTV